jgi:hypothetical protein
LRLVFFLRRFFGPTTVRTTSQIFKSIKWDPSPAIHLQSWPISSESRSPQTVEKWMYLRILIQVLFNWYCSIGNKFTQATWINILRYIHFSTVCGERDSLEMGQLWRRIAGLGSHLIDLKIWDIGSQKCNNENYLTFWIMKVVFLCPLIQQMSSILLLLVWKLKN